MEKPTIEDLVDLTQEVVRLAGEVAVARHEHEFAAWNQQQLEAELAKAEAELLEAHEAVTQDNAPTVLN